jgi:biopolymer transport protein ExbD/biopolymer transport protein TolR
MLNNKVNVDLPKSDAAVVMEDANKEDAVVLAVTRDGRIFLGANPISLDDLTPRITDMLTNQTNKAVYLRGDIRAPYGKVLDAVDGARSAGVNSLGLLTEKRDDTIQK